MHRILTCLLLLVGCDPAPSSEPAAVSKAPAVPGQESTREPTLVPAMAPDASVDGEAVADTSDEALLVWGVDEEGGVYTWWVERDGLGDWTAMEAEGIHLAVDDGLWEWSVTEEALPLGAECEFFDAEASDGSSAVAGTGVRVALENEAGERRTLVEPLRTEARQAADWREHVRLEGSVGPYLFVHRSAWGYHCGAHGGTADDFRVIDARTGQPSSLYDSRATEALVARHRESAWAAFEGEMVFADGPDGLSLTLHRPVFGDAGIRLAHQLTAETCYACSDGAWDSYTTSTTVDDDALPDVLSPFADVPTEPIRWLRERVEGLEVRGVSRPRPSLRPAFEARQVDGC